MFVLIEFCDLPLAENKLFFRQAGGWDEWISGLASNNRQKKLNEETPTQIIFGEVTILATSFMYQSFEVN